MSIDTRLTKLEQEANPKKKEPEIKVIEVWCTDGKTETLRERYVWDPETNYYNLEKIK